MIDLDIKPDMLAPAVREVAELCDIETAFALVEHFGGCRFYVPTKWREGHELNVIGVNHAQDLINKLGGAELSMPRRPYTARGLQKLVERLILAGYPQRAVALKLNIAMKTVRDIRKGKAITCSPAKKIAIIKDSRQTDLEDWLAEKCRTRARRPS